MDKKQFSTEIFIIFEDRGIKEMPSMPWLDKLYGKINDITELEFARGLKKINDISQEQWHKKYGFGGKPAMVDWINFFTGQSNQSPEQQAIIQVARILDYASFYLKNDVIFDNEFTNATVKKYGGMSKIAWEIDKFNDNKRPREWVSKELKELWVACYDGNIGDYTLCVGESKPKIFKHVKGKFTKTDDGHTVEGIFIKQKNIIDYVGDKNKCLTLMNKTEDKPLNLNVQQKTKEIVSNLAKGFKTI